MRTLSTLFLLLCPAGLIHATIAYVTFTSESPGSTVNRQILDSTYDASSYNLTAGLMNFDELSGDFIPNTAPFFSGFCIEPQVFVTAGTNYTYTIEPLDQGTLNIGGMGTTKADELEELFARYYPVFGATLDSETAGALQIATWEVVRETAPTLDVYSGNVIFSNEGTPGMLALAETMVQSITGTGPRLNNLVAMVASGVQDMVVQVPGGGAQDPVAEPSTFGIAGFALIGLGILRRRR
jgi:hypothetical protein